ncbi:MAG TPA: energy transducer TonB [Aeromonadales bacterium]|nr:energy transducer TonB [Aeromonadales bacterium]
MQRLGIGLLMGAVVTFFLFVFMAVLIEPDGVEPKKGDYVSIDLFMDKINETTRLKDREPPKKPEPPKAPPPPQAAPIRSAKPSALNVSLNIKGLDTSLSGGGPFIGGTMTDGDAIPWVVIPATYPRKALMDGIEGYVTFEFTVMPDGSPKDVKIVDAKPRRLFDRAALRAVYKWKFKPRVEDGVAIEQKHMRYTMEFKLEQ